MESILADAVECNMICHDACCDRIPYSMESHKRQMVVSQNHIKEHLVVFAECSHHPAPQIESQEWSRSAILYRLGSEPHVACGKPTNQCVVVVQTPQIGDYWYFLFLCLIEC